MIAAKLRTAAIDFCDSSPHRDQPFCKRNWGGTLHSLCSYHGKLKPSIAHFLIKNFTEPGDRVLDPLSGVGTIPLEARRLGRVAIANDLSLVAAAVSAAKLLPVSATDVQRGLAQLADELNSPALLEELVREVDVTFGLNGPIESYYHPDTLREVLLARKWFLQRDAVSSASNAVLMTCVLHILHGNRPYTLSRNSHPVTPFAPSGPVEYRGLLARLTTRLDTVMPLLTDLSSTCPPGTAVRGDYSDLELAPVDAIVTSPPFAKSVRFWSMNWLRLWFSGWDADAFATEPKRFLEHQQRKDLSVYRTFASSAHQCLKPGGSLILHLGETAATNMSDEIVPHLETAGFEIAHVGRECVRETESHGLTDKGATVAHWYVFARAL